MEGLISDHQGKVFFVYGCFYLYLRYTSGLYMNLYLRYTHITQARWVPRNRCETLVHIEGGPDGQGRLEHRHWLVHTYRGRRPVMVWRTGKAFCVLVLAVGYFSWKRSPLPSLPRCHTGTLAFRSRT